MDSKVRVALVNLTAGGLSGGYIKYLRSLVPLMLRSDAIRSLDVFVPPDSMSTLAKEGWPVRTWPAADGARGFPELRRAVREVAPDVVFVPSARWLDCRDVPVVCMVRNMEPLEVPFNGNSLREGLRNMARAFAARRACRRAARVIAVSGHVKDYLLNRWHLPPSKVGVVYHGVDSPPATGGVRPPAIDANLAGQFAFTAGSIRPARGLEDLVEALPPLTASAAGPVVVVIAGQPDAGAAAYVDRLKRRARALGVAERIIWTGPLDELSMSWCYSSCRAFVMTSRAEACPNVALEAMSHGCPCVSVDHAPMPEFFGPSAVYYRAGDATGLAAALLPVLAGSANVAALKAGATSRARTFDWRVTLQRTLSELRLAAEA